MLRIFCRLLSLPPVRNYLRSAAWDQRRLVEGAREIELLCKYHQEYLNMVKYILMTQALFIFIINNQRVRRGIGV